MDFSPDLLCFDLVCIFYFEKANHRLSNIEKISEQARDFCVLAWTHNDVVAGDCAGTGAWICYC